MEFIYNDGGRSQYFKGKAGDCVTRAIAIALNKDYKETYNEIAKFLGYTPRNGVTKADTKKVMKHFGLNWVPTMRVGEGCRVHMKSKELPKGVIIVNLSGHVCCVIDGVMYDTHDCSREETRCVYGYWAL